MDERDVDILLVEDDPGHGMLIQRALSECTCTPRVRHLRDAPAALVWLDAICAEVGSRPPKLTLLDLKLPGMGGLEFLGELRDRTQLAGLPVLVLSTSDAPMDVAGAYANGANAYLVKPTGWEQMRQQMQAVCDFWLELNRT